MHSLPIWMDLDNVHVASPCEADWDGMEGTDTVRFCGECRKNVYNLSEMTRSEAADVIREHEGRLCVRFFRRQDGTLLTQDCPVGLRALRRRLARRLAAVAAMFAAILFGRGHGWRPAWGEEPVPVPVGPAIAGGLRPLEAQPLIDIAPVAIPRMVRNPSAELAAPPLYQLDLSRPDDRWQVTRDGRQNAEGMALMAAGRLHDDQATLTLKNLPQHRRLHVQCDVRLLGSWDGDSDGVGPDTFSIILGDGRQLLSASFADRVRNQGQLQSFPDLVGKARHGAGSGFAEMKNPSIPAPSEMTYQLDFTFPHQEGEVRIAFVGRPTEPAAEARNADNESWGLAGVRVFALADSSESLDQKTVTALVTQLESPNPVEAHRSLWRLAGAGPDVVPLLERMFPAAASALSEQQFTQLVAQLDEDAFARREAAMDALRRVPAEQRKLLLHAALNRQLSPEQQLRLEKLVAEMQPDSDAARRALRTSRLLHLLHVIGTDDARKLADRLTPAECRLESARK